MISLGTSFLPALRLAQKLVPGLFAVSGICLLLKVGLYVLKCDKNTYFFMLKTFTEYNNLLCIFPGILDGPQLFNEIVSCLGGVVWKKNNFKNAA